MAIVDSRGEPDGECNTVTNEWPHFDSTPMVIFSRCSLMMWGVEGQKDRHCNGRIQTGT